MKTIKTLILVILINLIITNCFGNSIDLGLNEAAKDIVLKDFQSYEKAPVENKDNPRFNKKGWEKSVIAVRIPRAAIWSASRSNRRSLVWGLLRT